MADQSTELVVFSDDWGRHPSSCQHLVNELIHDMPALWVNTIGMRLPRITASDIKKIAGKLKQWTQPKTDSTPLPANLRVINPLMYPGFRNGLQRRVNAQLLSRQINRQLDTQTSM